MAEIKLYGIPNCDTTRQAITWLNKKKATYSFHDYKQLGISKQKLEEWCDKAGLETIFNKRSATWKKLPATEQAKSASRTGAIQLMSENTSIIKRPVIEKGKELIVGFKEEQYTKHLK